MNEWFKLGENRSFFPVWSRALTLYLSGVLALLFFVKIPWHALSR